MLVDSNAAIITDYIKGVGRYFSRRKIPGGGKHILWLLHLFSVYIQNSLLKGDGFTGETDDPFKEQHPVTGKAEGDYIKTPGRVIQVTQPPAKMKTAVSDGRFHAHPLDVHRNKDVAKDNQTQQGYSQNSEASCSGQSWQEKLSYQ